MDPIHPIITPQPPLPPISPAARAERVARDSARERPGQGYGQRRRPPLPDGAEEYEDFDDQAQEGRDDDEHPHIDITA